MLFRSPKLKLPSPLYFITQYYVPEVAKRAKEIDRCLKTNNACKYIDKIILLNESMLQLPVQSSKIKQYNIGTRLRFDIVFKWIYENAPSNAIICIANSDIYIDNSWRNLWSINMNSIFFSILRWDEQEDPSESPILFGPRADSQDTWVISAKAVKSRVWDWSSLNFPFGQGGCDNAINTEMLRQKFQVVNPCMSLITHHVHMTKYRTYDPGDVVAKPVYMYVNPSGLHDLNPEINITAPIVKTFVVAPIILEFQGSISVQQRTTLLTMLSKDREVPLSEKSLLTSEFKLPVYEFENVFQLSTGLLRTYSSIIVGNSQACSDAWSKEEVSIASASVSVDVGLIAPCPDEIAENPVRYLLEYMGKIFALRKIAPTGEWLGVKDLKIMNALKLFSWQQETIPVVIRTPAFQTWCKKAYAWLPQDKEKGLVTSIEIDALREALIDWAPLPTRKRIVLYVDDVWITDNSIEMFEKLLNPSFEFVCIYPTTHLSMAISILNGATAAITYSGKDSINRWGTLWALPSTASIWEIQPEVEPSLDLYHVSKSSKLVHKLHIVPRSTATQTDITRMVDTICKLILKDEVIPSKKLAIYMPHKDTKGFFAHAGDSFREMVELWLEREYIDVHYVEGLRQIWLGSVGDTLLYDRPTLQWLDVAPVIEKTWRKALFGNPPPTGESSSAWSFWARRPRLLEDLFEQGIGLSKQRPLGLVFYGRSENNVQMSKRSTEDWSSICDEFVHVIGDKPYPHTQRGYLMRLSNAKWGLCLAGYGNKCHREIECMALGCVPIVSDEVDMTHYKNPPMEGLHYFRVKTPADVEAIVKMPHDTWIKSSEACRNWWKENASVEGLWLLTQSLYRQVPN